MNTVPGNDINVIVIVLILLPAVHISHLLLIFFTDKYHSLFVIKTQRLYRYIRDGRRTKRMMADGRVGFGGSLG